MEAWERWLSKHALAVSLILSFGVSYGFSINGVVSEWIMPFGDGEHYALRGMTLYGYLHSGQWSQFWNVFTLPKQSLAPLHYWIFFLLPQAWACTTSYGIVQVVTTYGLLAFGVWELCRTLDRVEWTPALFLLCAFQNMSLDRTYFYFADVPFAAFGTVALAWQMRAWRAPSRQNSMLSGMGAGLLFWIKAPNALIFMGTYFLAEIIRALICFFAKEKTAPTDSAGWKKLMHHALAVCCGFIPAMGLGLACGGLQSIIRLVNANEVSDFFTTRLECTGLLRLFYFPLCLTWFYHAIILVLIFTVVTVVSLKLHHDGRTTSASPAKTFPFLLLIPLLVAYLIFGEFFSFGMAAKDLRSLLLALPIFWLAIFWVMERCHVRPGSLLLAAVAYAICGYSQIYFDAFESKSVDTQSYQLKDDWLCRLPAYQSNNSAGTKMTASLLVLFKDTLPAGGKIAVGSEMLYLTSESFTWTLQHNMVLQGQSAPYEFKNFLTRDGKYCRSALINARGILVFVHPSVQYTREVHQASISLVQFCAGPWLKDGVVAIAPLQASNSEIFGYFILIKKPLADDQITQIIHDTHSPELSPDTEFNVVTDERLTWQQSWDILMRWRQKRLGK